jgi:hypothetical protein
MLAVNREGSLAAAERDNAPMQGGTTVIVPGGAGGQTVIVPVR